jgi:hypothetical protein
MLRFCNTPEKIFKHLDGFIWLLVLDVSGMRQTNKRVISQIISSLTKPNSPENKRKGNRRTLASFRQKKAGKPSPIASTNTKKQTRSGLP